MLRSGLFTKIPRFCGISGEWFFGKNMDALGNCNADDLSMAGAGTAKVCNIRCNGRKQRLGACKNRDATARDRPRAVLIWVGERDDLRAQPSRGMGMPPAHKASTQNGHLWRGYVSAHAQLH